MALKGEDYVNPVFLNVNSFPIFKRNNVFRLFAGFLPRVIGFTIGGFIFFGVYEQAREFCISYFS